MNWEKDRDALIAQTMAFVQSVTAQKAENSGPDIPKPTLPAINGTLEARSASKSTPPLTPVKVEEDLPVFSTAPRPIAPSEVASEIRERIAGFRAHQERFSREREKYFNETLAKLRAALDEVAPPRPSPGK
jgi:hypothetical protein